MWRDSDGHFSAASWLPLTQAFGGGSNVMQPSIPRIFLPLVGMLLGLLAVIQASAADDLPSRFRGDRDRLTEAFGAFQKVSNLTTPPPGQSSFPGSPQHRAAVLTHLEKGLLAADGVSDEFLDWLHPQMRDYFRTKLIAGQRSYHDGLRGSDEALQVRGIMLIREWDRQFWRSNAKSITDKAFQ